MTPPSNEPAPFAGRPAPTDIDIQFLIDVAVERAIDRLLAAQLSRIGPRPPILSSVDHNQPSIDRGATPLLGPVRTNSPSNGWPTGTANAWGARPDRPEQTPPGVPPRGDPGGAEQAARIPTPQPNRTVTVPEAARMVGISRSHAYDLIHRGELAGVRLGRRIVVPISAIDKMLASGSTQAS